MMIYLNQSMLQLYQTYKNFLVCVGVIDIQNISEYLKWCLVRYLHSANLHPAKIRKIGILYRDKLDFKDIKFPVKIKSGK